MSGVASPKHHPEPLSWADSRLRLGQTNVGFWTLMAVGLLIWSPSLAGRGLLENAVAWILCVAGFVVLQLPFDVVGGWLIPSRFGRGPATIRDWRRGWIRGVIAHSTVSLLGGWTVLSVGHLWGEGAALVSMVVLALGLVAIQGGMARWMGRATFYTPKEPTRRLVRDAGLSLGQVDFVDVSESGFVGAWVGMPGRERLMVPKRWITSLPEASLKMALRRRAWALNSGARGQGMAVALAFVILGIGLVLAVVPDAGLTRANGLLMTSAGFTLWSFLGLLTLPSLSRRAVMNIDRMAVTGAHEVALFEQTIRALDSVQEDEDSRPVWVERIFHPVPAPNERFRALRSTAVVSSGLMPYRVTRNMLFTSWAGFSWLSRAVHCNCGRPVLWAIPPGD